MATHVLNDAYVSLATVDLSDHVRSVELTIEADEQDATAMANGGYSQTLTGLKTGTINLEFNQDYAAGEVDATLFPLFGTTFAFEIRPTSAVVGATNPKWTGSAQMFNYNPIAGSVGQTNTTPVTLKIQGAVTRAVA
jgi:hypothetical protein